MHPRRQQNEAIRHKEVKQNKEPKAYPKNNHENNSLKVCLKRERLVSRIYPHPRLAVLAHAFLEEVSLALKGDHLHPVKRVYGVVLLIAAELHEEAVSAKLDVLPHQSAVHADQLHRQRGCDKLLHIITSTRGGHMISKGHVGFISTRESTHNPCDNAKYKC